MQYYYNVIFTLFLIFKISVQAKTQTSMQDWQYPSEVHKITISDSLEIAYVDEGAGDNVLLFIHGLGSNLQAWQKNIEILKKDSRCIALDLPGYGKSSKTVDSLNLTLFAESVRAFVDSLNLENVILVGHSMGGQVALQTVLNNTERIHKLILIAPAGLETFTTEEKLWFQSIFTPAVVKATPEEQIVKNFQINFHEMPKDAQFMIEDRLLMRQSDEYDYYCTMIPQCMMGMLNEPVYDRLSEIQLPSLIIFGENDLLIPNKFLHPTLTTLEVAKLGQKSLSDSELRMISAAGHFVQWEQSEKVNEEILNFIKAK